MYEDQELQYFDVLGYINVEINKRKKDGWYLAQVMPRANGGYDVLWNKYKQAK
jgi:hypothetical protein